MMGEYMLGLKRQSDEEIRRACHGVIKGWFFSASCAEPRQSRLHLQSERFYLSQLG